MNFTISSIGNLPKVSGDFLEVTKNNKHFAFYGTMGAGKTTFIKALCKQLGVVEVVTSPTFSIVNEYHTENDEVVYHFDFYRINAIEELFDLGYEDYLYSENYCFIEWPEKGEALLPDHFLKINIHEMPDGSRMVDF